MSTKVITRVPQKSSNLVITGNYQRPVTTTVNALIMVELFHLSPKQYLETLQRPQLVWLCMDPNDE